jgi:hypothetical protein
MEHNIYATAANRAAAAAIAHAAEIVVIPIVSQAPDPAAILAQMVAVH